MQKLITLSQGITVKAQMMTANTIENVRNFHQEETSAKGTSEEGTLMYGVIVVGVIVAAIVVPNLDSIYDSIIAKFQNGVTKVPVGW